MAKVVKKMETAEASQNTMKPCRTSGVSMFARVVTAQAEAGGFDSVVRFAREHLPAAHQQPGFRGFYLLSDPQSGKLMTISLWETQEHLQAGEAQAAQLRGQAAPPAALTGLRVDRYEVTMSA